MADKYPGWSPYNYVLGNPLRMIDPDGLSAEQANADLWFKLYWLEEHSSTGNDSELLYSSGDASEGVVMEGDKPKRKSNDVDPYFITFGISGSLVLRNGLNFETGFLIDQKGDIRLYLKACPSIGLGADVSIEATYNS